MIFWDKIETVQRIETGEYDRYGEPIMEDVRTVHRAQVDPLNTAETVTTGQQVQTRYRAILSPSATLDASGAVYWDGKEFEVEGDVETHKVHGRPHHQEFVMHRVTG